MYIYNSTNKQTNKYKHTQVHKYIDMSVCPNIEYRYISVFTHMHMHMQKNIETDR